MCNLVFLAGRLKHVYSGYCDTIREVYHEAYIYI